MEIAHQDLQIANLISKGIQNIPHNQTIYRVSCEGYHALLKCLVLTTPIEHVEYYENNKEYPTLAILFGEIQAEELTDISYLSQLPTSVAEIQRIMTQLITVKMATLGE